MDTTDNTLTDGTEGSGLFLAHVLFGPTTDPLTQLQSRLEKAGFTVHVSQDRKFGGWGTLQSGNALELTLDDETTAFFSFVNAAIPAQEAETVAENNYRWPDARAAVAKHTAYFNVALQHRGEHRLDAAKTFVKMIVATLNHRSAIGVYFNATVYEKNDYLQRYEKAISEDPAAFPIENLVWVGLTPDDERGTSALRTFGCNAFGLKEIERRRIARRLRDETQFLYAVARWVIENHVELKAGDTCGYTRDEYRPISEAPSVFFQNDLVLVLGDDDPPDPTTGKKPSVRRSRRSKGTHYQITVFPTTAKKRSRA